MRARTTALPAPHQGDPIWTVEHIALALRREVRSTRTLVATPGFPAPFQVSPGANARNYWLRDDVMAHFARRRAATPQPSPTPATAAASAPAQAVACSTVSAEARATVAARLARRHGGAR